MSQPSIIPHHKTKPASLIGAPISAEECQQLKKAFAEKYPDQVPAVFISREIIMSSIEGLSNVSGIRFSYGLGDAAAASSRIITLVPCRNRYNGESGMIPVISPKGYLCDNGDSIDFEKLLQLLGNHVTNFRSVSSEIPLSKVPRGYFWGIKRILRLLAVENCAGLVFHFGFNEAMKTACRQFQSVLEVVDANRKSLIVFEEYGQCPPPCHNGIDDPSSSYCIATAAAEKFSKDAESKLDVLRAFRDNWLVQQENGQSLYELYYFLSSFIVTEIQDQADQEAIWQEIYNDGFSKCLGLIEQGRSEEAKTVYVNLMHSLTQRFLMQ